MTLYLTVRNCPGRSKFIQPGMVWFGTREKLQEFSVEAVQHVPEKLVSVLHRFVKISMLLNIGRKLVFTCC